MNELHQSLETASENGFKGSPGIGTLGRAKVARENLSCDAESLPNANNNGMSEWGKQAAYRQKEMRENGDWKSTAERFIENPRIHRAVRRFCYECNGFSLHHATNCENTNCALWLFRHGKTIPHEDELPVWRKAHKRWLQSAGEV